MRTIIAITRFELRQQLGSAVTWGALLLGFVLHFLSVGSVGISLWAHPQANVNSAYALAVVHSTLTVVEMLPLLLFVAGAVLRDDEYFTADLVFVKPVSMRMHWTGKYAAVCVLAMVLGFAATLGSAAGALMPWVDDARRAAFSWQPYLFCFFAIELPNLFVLAALFFGIAVTARSLSAVVCVAAMLVAADFLLAGALSTGVSPGVLSLADHSAMLVVSGASRNLSVAELNTLYPTTLLAANRLVWLTLSLAVLFAGLKIGAHGSLRSPSARRQRSKPEGPDYTRAEATIPSGAAATRHPVSRSVTAWVSQFRFDVVAILANPLFLLLLVLAIVSALTDYATHVSPVMKSPLYPVTAARLGFFRYGLLPLAMVIAVYFPALLVHRERSVALAELLDATPASGWVRPLAKVAALTIALLLMLTAALLTVIAKQVAEGGSPDMAVYLRAVYVHNGVAYLLMVVMAVTVQSLTRNKWAGMLVVLALTVFMLNMKAMGLDHILYRFDMPSPEYSDMNGFGSSGLQAGSLAVYWTFFCGLLAGVACLFYPRGTDHGWRSRFVLAAARLRSRPARIVFMLSVTGWCVAGSWIFYNTNVRNTYRPASASRHEQAEYERLYGKYEDMPSPSFAHIDVAVDLFPDRQQVRCSGTATLLNNKRFPIREFVISLDPRLHVQRLEVAGAAFVNADTTRGFYLVRPSQPLAPGRSLVLRWATTRSAAGFTNDAPEKELLDNGTYLTSYSVMPVPGYDDTRQLTDNAARRRENLPPGKGLPRIGDRRYLDKLFYGFDARCTYRVVIATSADQLGIASGRLTRRWRRNGRSYYEYRSERPTWPKLYFVSARYAVAQEVYKSDNSNVNVDICYHPQHRSNISGMLASVRTSLDYFTRQFGPYPYSYLRIMEYPRYRTSAQALPGGGIAYSEGIGWTADMAGLENLDYTTIHELSHKWWGEQAYGAKMQGREVLNETLAQYSTLMIYQQFQRQHPRSNVLYRVIAELQAAYLEARNRDDKPERALLYTDKQGYVSYNKGALAMFELQERIGEAKVNLALRRYLRKFAFRPAPFPTARDLESELRVVAGPAFDALITDLFEKVLTYDLQLTQVSAIRKKAGDYEVTLHIAAHKTETDGSGRTREVGMQTPVDIAFFNDAKKEPPKQPASYLRKHDLHGGANTLLIRVKRKPAFVCVDPFRKLADKEPENNGREPDERER